MNATQLCFDVTKVWGSGVAVGMGVGMLLGYAWCRVTRRTP